MPGLGKVTTWIRKFQASPLAVVLVGSEGIFSDCFTKGILIVVTPSILEQNLHMKGEYNGLLNGVASAAGVVSAFLVSYISDKHAKSRRKPFYVAPVSMLVVLGIMLIISTAFWQQIVGRIAYGLYMGVAWSLGLGAVNDVYPRKSKGVQLSSTVTFAQAGYMLGPLVGGNLYDRWGPKAVGIFVIGYAVFDLFFKLGVSIEPKTIRARIIAEKEASQATVATQNLDVVTAKDPLISTSHGNDYENNNTNRNNSNIDDDFEYRKVQIHQEKTNSTTTTTTSDNTNLGSQLNLTNTLSKELTYWQLITRWSMVCLLSGTFAEAVFVNFYEVVFPIELQRVFGYTPGKIGNITIALTLPGIVTSVPIGKLLEHFMFKYPWLRRDGEIGFILAMGIIVFTNVVAVFLMPLVKHNVAGWIFMYCIFSICRGLIMVVEAIGLGHYIDSLGSNSNAKCFALNLISWSIGSVISPIIVAEIYEALDFNSTIFLTGAIGAVLVLIILSKPIYCFATWYIRNRSS